MRQRNGGLGRDKMGRWRGGCGSKPPKSVTLWHADAHLARHRRLDVAIVDLATRDRVRAPIERDALCEARHAVLARRVRRRARARAVGRDGAVIDYASPLRCLVTHEGERGLRDEEGCREVGVDHLGPRGEPQLAKIGRRHVDARIVECDVHPPRAHLLLICQVGRAAEGLHATTRGLAAGCCLLERGRTPPRQHDRTAHAGPQPTGAGRKAKAHGAANTSAGASDEGDRPLGRRFPRPLARGRVARHELDAGCECRGKVLAVVPNEALDLEIALHAQLERTRAVDFCGEAAYRCRQLLVGRVADLAEEAMAFGCDHATQRSLEPAKRHGERWDEHDAVEAENLIDAGGRQLVHVQQCTNSRA
eukprot:2762363-Prymnesium_polylepis.1